MRQRQPRGFAKSDYSAPCPYCGTPPKTGEAVTRIDTGRGYRKWWHQACRDAYLSTLRKEWS